jgi:hypothetical protein
MKSIAIVLLRVAGCLMAVGALGGLFAGFRWGMAGLAMGVAGRRPGIEAGFTARSWQILLIVVVEGVLAFGLFWAARTLQRSQLAGLANSSSPLMLRLNRLLFAAAILILIGWPIEHSYRVKSQVEELCAKYPIGASNAGFFDDAMALDPLTLRFWDQASHVDGGGMVHGSSDRNIVRFRGRYLAMDHGNAYVTKTRFVFYRINCSIEFTDRKVTRAWLSEMN